MDTNQTHEGADKSGYRKFIDALFSATFWTCFVLGVTTGACFLLYDFFCHLNHDLARGTLIETMAMIICTILEVIVTAMFGAILGIVPGAILGVLFISIEAIIIIIIAIIGDIILLLIIPFQR